jgi:hypothetical protein
MVADTAEPFFAPDPVELEISFGAPRRQRRWSVALRGLLFVPLLVLVGALRVVCAVLAVIGWFSALVLGRLPRWIATFQLKAIFFSVGVNAYVFLLVDKYPPFALSPAGYPIAVKIGASRLSRLRVFFRWLLSIPVGIVSSVARNGLLVLSPIIWLSTLILGRPPQPLFSVAAAVIRYQARYYAYMGLVTDTYPRKLFGDADSDWAPEGFRVLRSGATELVMGVIVVLGIAVPVANIVLRYELTRPPPRNHAVVAAEGRLENASVNAVAVVGCKLRCEKAHERVLGEAYLGFASTLSRIRFSGVQRRQVPVLIVGARTIGQAMLAVSKSKDGGRAQGIDPADPGDSPGLDDFDGEIASVLGPGPGGRIR